MRIKILTVFLLTILFICGSNGNNLPEYTPMAFTQGGFQNFNEKYLGNSPYFYMPVIAPKYIENNITLIGEAVDRNIDNIFTESKKWWIPSFVQNRTDSELRKTLHEAVKNGLNEFRYQDYIKDLWGVCVANSNNDENGEENLFVFIDPVQGKLASIDFGHPEDISSFISMGIDQLKNSLFKFKINANSIVVPSTNVLLLPDGELELKDPRGICTNRKGRFWIADRGNNRIVHLKYDPDRKAFTYLGQLTGLNSPMDVSIIESENASDPLVLCIANSGENNIVYVNADISGTVALSGITDEQKFVITEY